MAKYVRADAARPDADSMLVWGVAFGVPVIAVGLAMTGYIDFWRGIGLMTAGLVVVIGDVWIGHRAWKTKQRTIATVAATGLCAVILWLVFVPAPLGVLIERPAAHYPVDSDFYGIQWKSDYYPVNFLVENDTNGDYADFETYVETNLSFTRIGIKKSINQCDATKDLAGVKTAFGELAKLDNGKLIEVTPVLDDDSKIVSSFYHIRCSRIAPHSSVQLALAVIVSLRVV